MTQETIDSIDAIQEIGYTVDWRIVTFKGGKVETRFYIRNEAGNPLSLNPKGMSDATFRVTADFLIRETDMIDGIGNTPLSRC